MTKSKIKLFKCYFCKNASPKEEMIALEIDIPTNPNKPKKKGYRYYHPECFNKRPTYYHLKKLFESDFKKIFDYINNKLKEGKLIPFKDVSNFLYFKMPYKVWRNFFDESLMKYIRKEMGQSVLEYSTKGYLPEILDEYNLKNGELYIVGREKGYEIRSYNAELNLERRNKTK
jgi:hypothetical protein